MDWTYTKKTYASLSKIAFRKQPSNRHKSESIAFTAGYFRCLAPTQWTGITVQTLYRANAHGALHHRLPAN